MKQKILRTIMLAAFTAIGGVVHGQAPGSITTYGGNASGSAMSIANGGTTADAAESLYIGPGSYTIDGTWEIYSKNVWISPDAVISGTGTIVFLNPSVAGGAAAATLVDGNNSSQAIDVNIQLQNAMGMQLSQLAADATLTGASWTDVTTSSSLYTGKDLLLSTDGANITLGSGTQGDLVLDADATISSYSSARMVITNNSTLSHMVKENAASAFVFPVGIAAGDYTPATVAGAPSQDIWVSVTSYAGSSAIIEAPAEGMDRTWHIYGSAAAAGNITLQHNNSTDGAAYADASAFITQYQGTNQWSSSAMSDFISSGIHSKSGMAIPGSGSDVGSWFTKTSDAVTPLPVTLLSFTAKAVNCSADLQWQSGSEHNFRHYELQRSTDGSRYTTIATVAATGSNSRYAYTDAAPAEGNNYYRLKLVDMDGTYSYSPIATVQFNCGQAQLVLYPNPTYGIVTLEGLRGNEQVLVTDVLGRMMKQVTANGTSLLQVDLDGLAAATYQLTVIGNTQVRTFKIVKK